jgi:hypothetical protein
MSNNAFGADNQQATRRCFAHQRTIVFRRRGSSETIRQTPFAKSEILAYVHGAMHDGSLNKQKRVRIAQRNRDWLEMICDLLRAVGIHSWIYREGKNRNLYILETVSKELSFNFNPLQLRTNR